MRLKCSEKKHAFPLFTTATVVFLPYNQAIRTRLSDVTIFVLWKPHVNPLVFLISLWLLQRNNGFRPVIFNSCWSGTSKSHASGSRSPFSLICTGEVNIAICCSIFAAYAQVTQMLQSTEFWQNPLTVMEEPKGSAEHWLKTTALDSKLFISATNCFQ